MVPLRRDPGNDILNLTPLFKTSHQGNGNHDSLINFIGAHAAYRGILNNSYDGKKFVLKENLCTNHGGDAEGAQLLFHLASYDTEIGLLIEIGDKTSILQAKFIEIYEGASDTHSRSLPLFPFILECSVC